MKIIHTADVHLGSKMDSKFSKEIADERKAELRNTFKRLVEYAKENDVSVIMLCGDVFDSDRPFKKDKDFFYSIVAANPEIDFLYLKGNHDISDSIPEELPQNLKLFSGQWTTYSYGNVVICGTELCPANSSSYYSSLILDEEKYNIVMLHGQISDSLSGGDINLKKLKNKNIDYLALGHIHKLSQGQIDERGEYVYCGCLEGRGFDEPGEHGFVLLNAEKDKHTHTFGQSKRDAKKTFGQIATYLLYLPCKQSDIRGAKSSLIQVRPFGLTHHHVKVPRKLGTTSSNLGAFCILRVSPFSVF